MKTIIAMSKLQFHKVLSKKLKGQNLTQVARDIGVSQSLLHDWCKARRTPNLSSAETIKKLADYLGVSFEELLFGEESKPSEKILSSVSFSDDNKTYNIQIRRLE
jgi:transcriptional regulator with XRE-family HTH domain